MPMRSNTNHSITWMRVHTNVIQWIGTTKPKKKNALKLKVGYCIVVITIYLVIHNLLLRKLHQSHNWHKYADNLTFVVTLNKKLYVKCTILPKTVAASSNS